MTGIPTPTPAPMPTLALVESPDLEADAAVAVGRAVGLNEIVPPGVVGSSPIWFRVGCPLAGFDIKADAASHVQSSCFIWISSLWWSHPEKRSLSSPSHLASATHC